MTCRAALFSAVDLPGIHMVISSIRKELFMILTTPPGLGVNFYRTVFEDRNGQSVATDGALETLASLTALFQGRVWIILRSFNAADSWRTWKRLRDSRFFQTTGISAEHFETCREHTEKMLVCRELAVTHLIDSYPETFSSLYGESLRVRILFHPTPAEEAMWNGNVPRLPGVFGPLWTHRCDHWDEVVSAIRETF